MLESRAAIADLVHRYAFNIRSGLPAECAAFFAGDATFEVREADPLNPNDVRTRTKLAGLAAILEHISRSGAPGLRVMPLIHNLLIDVDGEAARSSCVMVARSWPSGHELVGEYDDAFRHDGRWRFQSRVFTILRATAGCGAKQ